MQGRPAHHALRSGAGSGAGAAVEGEVLQHCHEGLRGGVHAHAAVPLALGARRALHNLPLHLWEQRGSLLILDGVLFRHPTCSAGAVMQAGHGAGGLSAVWPGSAVLLWPAAQIWGLTAAPDGQLLAL